MILRLEIISSVVSYEKIVYYASREKKIYYVKFDAREKREQQPHR